MRSENNVKSATLLSNVVACTYIILHIPLHSCRSLLWSSVPLWCSYSFFDNSVVFLCLFSFVLFLLCFCFCFVSLLYSYTLRLVVCYLYMYNYQYWYSLSRFVYIPPPPPSPPPLLSLSPSVHACAQERSWVWMCAFVCDPSNVVTYKTLKKKFSSISLFFCTRSNMHSRAKSTKKNENNRVYDRHYVQIRCCFQTQILILMTTCE